MQVHHLSPIDTMLADLGFLVRRGRSGTLTEVEFATIALRLDIALATSGADPDGVLRARLGRLTQATEDETLTRDQFEEITGSMRVSLCERRSDPMVVVPNFAVLPSGVHGRRIGRFTVVDGGGSTHPETTLKGA